jgi:hypothetical protein
MEIQLRGKNLMMKQTFDDGQVKKKNKKECAFRGKKCKYPHVKAELYQYIMNTWINGFAVLMEMLQFQGCR